MEKPLYMCALNDYVFKLLFYARKNKELLMDFLNCMFEEYGGDKVQDLNYLSPILISEILHEKEGVVDFLCELQSGRKITIEMQTSSSPGNLKRVLFNGTKIYSSFQPKGSHYTLLDDVISISICNFVMFPKEANFVSYHTITDRETGHNDIDGITFIIVELPKLKYKLVKDLDNATMFDRWCFFLANSADIEGEDVDVVCKGNDCIKAAFHIADCVNWTKQQFKEYTSAYKGNESFEEEKWEYELTHAKLCLEKGLSLEDVKQVFSLDEEQISQLINQNSGGRLVVSVETNS